MQVRPEKESPGVSEEFSEHSGIQMDMLWKPSGPPHSLSPRLCPPPRALGGEVMGGVAGWGAGEGGEQGGGDWPSAL